MVERKPEKVIRGKRAVDGAGVHLVRVLGNETAEAFDPFLMLDSFDSKNPADYISGFPLHPHRGIETITYLISGEMRHGDSLGNSGIIKGGEAQWMTAGSGIMHEEMPKASEHMLGVQIWLNLPAAEKMTAPAYFDIKNDMIGKKSTDFGEVRVLSGEYEGVFGVKPPHRKARIMDITVLSGKEASIPTAYDTTVFVFLITGNAVINGSKFEEKSAVLCSHGDILRVSAFDNEPSRFLFFEGLPLKEPIAWGGPIVMNTRLELMTAYEELENNRFIK
ncbi:MAG: pirin family protein [Ruminococcus sp.]|jgi:redox-sensitive bicupin YhaK (pirin superfamily)|nr:pirin family protein [Ruminococcus sp.]